MARMIPDSLEFENCKSNGEKRIFDALKEKLPQDWVVIYSLRWVNIYNERSRKSNGEGDFLIISPKYGILVIEVKGGEINCKDKSWMSKDQNGITNNIQDPEKQANDTMYEIIGLLKTKGINGYVCSAVWFPDTIIEKINLPLSMPPHIVLDMRSLENPGKSISDVFEFRKSREKFSPKVFDKADFIRILDILNPEVRLVKAIKRIAEDVKDTYVRLNQEQSYAIEQFEENKRISIKGHAGTGKTLLAIQKCRKDSNEGKKVLFLCFNSKLADNIKNESNDFDVYTIHSFALNYLKRFFPARALNFDEDKDFDYIVEEYLEVIQKNKEKGFLLYDIIVVDEGQDFKEAWISSLENLINEEGSFFIFYDPLQVLYSDRAQADYSYLSIGAVCNLYRNMRNTDEICISSINVVDGLYDKVKPSGVKGKIPELIFCSSLIYSFDLLRKRVFDLTMVEYIEKENITILTMEPKNKETYIAEVGNEYQIEVETIRRFKGLENDFIIIPDLDCNILLDNEKRKMLYVAMSRARVQVYLIINTEGLSRSGKKIRVREIENTLWRGLNE